MRLQLRKVGQGNEIELVGFGLLFDGLFFSVCTFEKRVVLRIWAARELFQSV